MNLQEETQAVRRLEEASHWLLRLREEALGEAEMQQWLDWCEADPGNLEAFERMQAFWRAVPPTEASQPRRPPMSRTRGWKLTALAASLAVATASLTWLVYKHTAVPSDSRTLVRIAAPPRANQSSLLPDGSQLELGAGSVVALNYTSAQRHLDVRDGTAFFRVKPDKARPFVVQAGAVSVTAIGTAFNIRRNGARVVVTVEEGTVRIDRPGADPLRAEAGYRLTHDAGLRETQLLPAQPSAELAWRNGQLIYDGEPLAAVIENVNRYAPRRIVMADPSLGRLRYTGTVFTDSIDTWLNALPRAFAVEVRQDGAQITLLPR